MCGAALLGAAAAGRTLSAPRDSGSSGWPMRGSDAAPQLP
jgi:hypothetical protein